LPPLPARIDAGRCRQRFGFFFVNDDIEIGSRKIADALEFKNDRAEQDGRDTGPVGKTAKKGKSINQRRTHLDREPSPIGTGQWLRSGIGEAPLELPERQLFEIAPGSANRTEDLNLDAGHRADGRNAHGIANGDKLEIDLPLSRISRHAAPSNEKPARWCRAGEASTKRDEIQPACAWFCASGDIGTPRPSR
jgi:hypothetical protein